MWHIPYHCADDPRCYFDSDYRSCECQCGPCVLAKEHEDGQEEARLENMKGE